MKRSLIAVLIFLMSVACGNSGPGEPQEKDTMKGTQHTGTVAETRPDNEPGRRGPADWKNFRKPDDATLKRQLTPLQYEVTQQNGTEQPFRNEYNANKAEGVYVDIVSGEPLFSSLDKYESGTGWPSFHKPLEPGNIVTREDRGIFGTRTEVRSKHGDSHLGHVFNDGPPPTGLRYCMNSAALRFVPKDDLKREGYGEYAGLFRRGQK